MPSSPHTILGDEFGNQEDSDVRLFATGVVGCNPVTFLECKLAVRAYDPRRGLVWQRADHARGGDWNFVTDSAVAAGSLFVGAEELLDDGQYHGTVRSYAATDGAPKWDVSFDGGSGQPVSFVNRLAVLNGRLVAGGALFRSDGGLDFVARMYRTREE
jgi:hypothetical protein